MNKQYTVAVVGATGAVGTEILQVLKKRNFPSSRLKLLASSRSAGREIIFGGEKIKVEELTKDAFTGVDLALFSAGASRSREFAEAAVAAGAIVVDNSSAFRMAPDVPLVVPEVNPEDINWHRGIIANPNCTTILMLTALKPLHDISPIKRIMVSTYQSASGAGARAMEELRHQTGQILAGEKVSPEALPYQMAFNLFSHNSDVQEDGYCEEEVKMIKETRKMLHDETLRIVPTAIRVPLPRTHAEAIVIEQERKITVEEARSALSRAPGLRLVDEPEKNYFPMPIEAAGKDEVLVGRIRDDLSSENGLALFICGDQLLKGAALNAVQIAELVIKQNSSGE